MRIRCAHNLERICFLHFPTPKNLGGGRPLAGLCSSAVRSGWAGQEGGGQQECGRSGGAGPLPTLDVLGLRRTGTASATIGLQLWLAPCHICSGAALTPAHICTRTGLAPATSGPGLGPPLSRLHWPVAASSPLRTHAWRVYRGSAAHAACRPVQPPLLRGVLRALPCALPHAVPLRVPRVPRALPCAVRHAVP
jgi:hypothetical protein